MPYIAKIHNILTEEYLKYHYLILDKSSKDISNETNISRTSVERKLKSFNIHKNNQNIIGKTFFKLTVISYNKDLNKYLCLCTCGNTTLCRRDYLISNSKRTCGHTRRRENHHAYKGYKQISSSFWSHLKHSAKVRNIILNISMQDAWNLYLKQNRKCALSGLDLLFDSNNRDNDGNASLDRIDSDKEYTIDNVQWIHKDINKMKNNLKEKYFISMCELIYKYKVL